MQMKRRMSLICKCVFIFGLTLGGQNSFAQMAPANVSIRSISYAGSGCPAGSVSQNLAPDFKAFTLLFDSFIASVGPAEPISQKRKNCQINVDFSFPQGWTYALVSFDYRGYVDIERDILGLQQTSYYFQGAPQTARFKTSMPGPVNRDYQVRDVLDLTATVWSPCGESRSLNINSEVRLDNTRNRNGRGLITVDSIDGNIAHTYGIAWKRC
jgi:hypothetical protein